MNLGISLSLGSGRGAASASMQTAILALSGSTTAISNAATRYSGLVQSAPSSGWVASTVLAETPVPVAGVITNLYIRLGTALAAGSFTFTLVVNGADTAMTCTITDTVGVNNGQAISIAAGDRVCIKAVPTGTPTAQASPVAMSLVFTASGVAGVVFAGAASASTAGFIPPGSVVVGNATEALGSAVMPTAGKFSKLYFSATAAPGVGATRILTLRKNGVDQTLTCTLGAADTTISDLVNEVTYAAGDVISFSQTITGTPAAATSKIGAAWTPTVAGEGLMFGNWNGVISASATRFGSADGTSASAEATETNTYNVAPCNLEIKNFRALISTASGASGSRAFTLRKGGVATAAAVTISGASAVDGVDTDSVTFTDGDLFSIEAVPTGPPAAVTFARTSAVVISSSPGVTLSIDEVPFDGYVFALGPTNEAAAIVLTGTKVAAISSVQYRVELSDGTLVTDWGATGMTYPTAATWRIGSTSATYAVRTDGKDYVLKVRDAANTVNTTTAQRKWAPGVVLLFNDQSQFQTLFADGESPATGAPGVPTTNNVRGLWVSNKATATSTADAAITGSAINSATAAGSGWIEIANQMGIDYSSAHAPVMLVDWAYGGMSIDDFNNDEPVATGKWRLRTGFLAFLGTKLQSRCTGVVRMAVLDSASGLSTALDTLAGYVDGVFSSNPTTARFLLIPSMRYGEPQSTAYDFQAMRNAFVTKAAGGGRWSLLCWALPIHMDEDRGATSGAGHHQAQGSGVYSGATPHLRGNRWLGRLIGRGLGRWLQGFRGESVTLDAFGPKPISAQFTDAGKTAFVITFDKALKQRDAGGAIRGVWLSTNDWALSGGVYTASDELVTGYTLSISTSTVTVTRLSGSWTGNPKVDVLRGAPYDTVSITETTAITAIDRSLWGTDAYNDGVSTGLMATPVQGSGVTVVDA